MLFFSDFEVKNLSGEKNVFRSKNRIFIFCFWTAENLLISSFYRSKSISDVKITLVRVFSVLWWFFAIELRGPKGKDNVLSTGFPPASWVYVF